MSASARSGHSAELSNFSLSSKLLGATWKVRQLIPTAADRRATQCDISDGMKIATYNVNGIKSRISNLLTWLEREQPDIVCLQELKAMDSAFPSLAIAGAGYKSVAKGQRSWNGVAILGRGMEIVSIRDV